ncbi:hypothetical protein PSTT_06773 [Puccinia striiformis]|uniref:Uncharacterized protein n=1 Tax=Puccinia striiformis TaxID=27350 RepID=A0A2S4VJ24_9BASI|nr:hypothetical protein PSTT_06773 [Puccinia striiformis]
MAEYKQKLKKNPQFKYNSANIANLNEYNELWRDFPIKHIKAPSNAAAVATTQSAICRLHTRISQEEKCDCYEYGRSRRLNNLSTQTKQTRIGTLNRGSSDKIHSENLSLLKRISTKQERSSISDNNNTTTKSQLEERIQ